MPKLRILFIPFIILVVLSTSQCLTHEASPQTKPFEWDLSLENHTGMSKNQYKTDGKHRGMSVFNWERDNTENINQLVKNNIESVALVPFMFQRTDTTKTLRPLREKDGKWGRRDSSYMKIAKEIRARDMHVMLKPHIWMRQGWRSTIKLDNDKEWDTWFDSYRVHMIHYARLADQIDAEVYCIGTELRSSVNEQPHRWSELIKEIKSIYSGKLTYAANWDGEYDDIEFWDEMDYVGIQAYYPLTNNVKPTVKELKKGWSKHKDGLEKLSIKHNKKILFTETGYRSDDTAAIKPWEWGSAQDTSRFNVCNMTQANAYEAIFDELWKEEWFAGMYFWQWHNRHSPEYTVNNMDFTPRYKPAENVLAKWYGKEL